MGKKIDNESTNTGENWAKWLWRLFSSAKLAIALILIIAVLSVVGIFTSVDLFSSWYFVAFGILLMLNILICNINRWKGIQKNLKGSQIKQSENFEGQDKVTEIKDFTMPLYGIGAATSALQKATAYALKMKPITPILPRIKTGSLYSVRILSYLSIILLVLAYIIGSTLGFHESAFIVTEGETKEVGYDTGLSLNLISFTDSYYEDGMPSDYRSNVVLYKNGEKVAQSDIYVNRPLSYEGVRFYQSFFGPAAAMEVTKDGNVEFSGTVAFYSSFDSYGYYRNIGFIDIDESKLSLAIITPSFNTPDPMIPEGQLAVLAYKDGEELGVHILEKITPLEIDEVKLTYLSDSQYSDFRLRVTRKCAGMGCLLVVYYRIGNGFLLPAQPGMAAN